jgi:hypothetical protein
MLVMQLLRVDCLPESVGNFNCIFCVHIETQTMSVQSDISSRHDT